MLGAATAGHTVHRVSALVDGTGWIDLANLAGTTVDDQLLTVRPAPSTAAVRAVRIETTTSPSWVAWKEIEVVGG